MVSLRVAETEVFALDEVCVTPPTLVQALAFFTVEELTDQAESVETPPVSPNRTRNPLKDLFLLLILTTVLVLIGNVVVLPATRVFPPTEMDKPALARDPVVFALLK